MSGPLSKILGWVVRYAPELIAQASVWAPIVTEAAEVAPSVMAVIDEKAPDLRTKIAAAVKGMAPLLTAGTPAHEAAMEVVSTAVFAPGRWTPQAEKVWQDRAVGAS